MQNVVLITNQKFSKTVVLDIGSFNLALKQTMGREEEYSYKNGSVFFFLQQGNAKISNEFYSSDVLPGMYFSQKAPVKIKLDQNSKAVIIEINFYSCLNMVGGPIEPTGRLNYINGCSDTLLISPSRLGEPCLNLLHFPKNTNQTSHYHPSFRFGIVVSGHGESVSEDRSQKLNIGDCFFIPALVAHKFNTYGESMNVIAFHPDTDWGPTDEVHPMKNRTIFT
ncbi:MAG: cupin domain-containing protein [Bacteriovorax sp.]|nr:cupin domain-containing protein [Bacteriovorax sp.]